MEGVSLRMPEIKFHTSRKHFTSSTVPLATKGFRSLFSKALIPFISTLRILLFLLYFPLATKGLSYSHLNTQ